MNGVQKRTVFRFYWLYLYNMILLIAIQEQEIYNSIKKHLQELRKGVGDREGRSHAELRVTLLLGAISLYILASCSVILSQQIHGKKAKGRTRKV